MAAFNGLGMSLGTLARISTAQTRSISPENFPGAKGGGGMATEGTGAEAARDLGQGWKVSPSIRIAPGATASLAEIAGAGAIQQIWVTTQGLFTRSGVEVV
jgi:D-arabinan exo alpha-(1,3)/(1,5)-arabinofuranosidase (non-reducing end)